MKFFTKNSKKILISIVLVMLFNIITPTISQADFGGALFKPIADLICSVADIVLEMLHDFFTGNPNFKAENGDMIRRYGFVFCSD